MKKLNIEIMLKVLSADYAGGYTLICKFNNGDCKKVDLSPLLSYPAYRELKDLRRFEQFGLGATIFLTNGADIAPEWLLQHGTDA